MIRALRAMVAGQQGVGLAAALLMVSVLGSRALGLLRDVAIYGAFGLSPDLDAYYAAIRIPDILFQLLTGAALASAFIPTFTGLLARERRAEAARVAGTTLTVAVVATTIFAGVCAMAAPWIVQVLAPGFEPAQRAQTEGLLRLMLVSPVLFAASTIIGATLNGQRQFLLTSLAPWTYNLAIIAGALWLGPVLGVTGLAIGVVVGAGLHLLVQLPGITTGIRLQPGLDLADPGVREVGRLTLPRVLGMSAIYLNWLVITSIASTLPPGHLAGVMLAWSLMMFPLGMFGMSLAQAAFPNLTVYLARDQLAAFRAGLERALRMVVFLVLPSAIGLGVLGPYVVTALYQRGAFDATATVVVAGALAGFCLGLPAHGLLEVITRAFYAARTTLTPVLASVLAVAINLPLSFALASALQEVGLALGISIATGVEVVALGAIAWRRGLLRPGPGAWRGLGGTAVASAALGAVAVTFRALVGTPEGFEANLAASLMGALAAGAAFFGVASLLRLPELGWIAARLTGPLRRRDTMPQSENGDE